MAVCFDYTKEDTCVERHKHTTWATLGPDDGMTVMYEPEENRGNNEEGSAAEKELRNVVR